MAQDALYAAHADAVPLSQFSLWCTGTAVCQQLAGDLLAPVGRRAASVGEPKGKRRCSRQALTLVTALAACATMSQTSGFE